MANWLVDFFKYKGVVESALDISVSSTPPKNALDYTYDDSSTAVSAPGAGLFRLTDPDLTQATNSIIIDHESANGYDVSGLLDSPPLIEDSIILLEAGSSGNVLVGRVTAVTVSTGYTKVDISRVSSSAVFAPAEAIKVSYVNEGNVTYNTVSGNLEVGGVSIGDPADISQQFFKYVYNNTTSTTGMAIGQFRMNNLDPKLATTAWITNVIDETTTVNISSTYNMLAPGNLLFVRAKNSVAFGMFKIATVASDSLSGMGIKVMTFVAPGAVDGIAFTNNEEVFVTILSLGNMVYDATTQTATVNGVDVSGINTVSNFSDLPDPAVVTGEQAYKVTTPKVWVELDDARDAWVPFNGLARLYRNAAPIKSTAPATGASAIANNGSGKVRVTAAAHLMTSTQNGFEVYASAWAGTGVAGRYRVTYVDANNYDLPDLAYDVALGLPTIALCKGGSEKLLAVEIDLPPLTSDAVIRLISSSFFTDSAEDRRIIWALMNADRSGAVIINNRNDTTAGNTGEITNWGFRNRGATNSQQGLAILTQSGSPGTGTTAYPVESTIQTNVATKIQVYHILGDATTGTPQNYTINDLAIYWEN